MLQPQYDSLEDIFRAVGDSIRPAERLTVSQAAEKYRYLNNPPHYQGFWDNTMASYLVEPMDVLTSEEYQGMIFAGPARTGKSDMFFNWLTHTAICDPSDMLLIHMTQNTARDWSQGDLRKAFRHSKKLGEKVMPGRQNMNVHDVKFLSGMRLLVKWPTVTEVSGKTVRYGWAMDYDRMPADIDKEGALYPLLAKRGTTYGRHAMFAAESSPGFDITNPRWSPSAQNPHEAPPVEGGILSLYNQGDRRRRYWRCVQCREPFEPDFKHFDIPDSADKVEASHAATLACPSCGFPHEHDAGPGQPGKRELDFYGKWVPDRCRWDDNGEIVGEKIKTKLASFWLKGPHAAFTTWQSIIEKYLTAMEEYDKTGATEALKVTMNTDWGLAFLPPTLEAGLLPEDLIKRAEKNATPKQTVPEGVRFLIGTVDVQKHRFEVAVWGFGPNAQGTYDVHLIDRFPIRKSKRIDIETPGMFLQVEPGTYLEDWDLLIDAVIEKTYPLDDDSGRVMALKAVACDSAGTDGTTAKAYDFWRRLRDDEDVSARQHHLRFQLLKGIPTPGAPRVVIRYPDSERKDRHAGARGEIPILEINSNKMKDQASGILNRSLSGGQMVHLPAWLPQYVYSELVAEVRTPKGWEKPQKARNETWDLLVYAISTAVISRHAHIETIDWSDPPAWADYWDFNPMVFNPEEVVHAFDVQEDGPSIEELAALLG